MKRLLLLTIAVLVFPTCSYAAELGFQFSGVVTQYEASPFGYEILEGTPDRGGFVYETSTAYTHPGTCACQRGYEQRHINGFWAEFGDVRVQADAYVVQIGNNVPQFGGRPPIDTFTVVFANDINPSLNNPILVNGTPYLSGNFGLSFFANATVFADTSLPTDLDLGQFTPSPFIFLMDQSPGSPDIYYSIQTPEAITVLRSDHDLDGDVDGRDFLIWQRYFGTTGQNGDANSDQQVDASDLQDWQSQFGASTSIVQKVRAVPEPLCTTYIGFALLHTGLLRRRRLRNDE